MARKILQDEKANDGPTESHLSSLSGSPDANARGAPPRMDQNSSASLELTTKKMTEVRLLIKPE
jgi:hypothetical protein